jgi:hypothetical protein
MIEVLTDRLVPPPKLAHDIARVGGTTFFGQPKVILFWGQTLRHKLGFQSWSHRGPAGISVGSYEYLLGLNTPAWHLAYLRKVTEKPYEWDEKILGLYPAYGQYEIVCKFYHRFRYQNRLFLDVMRLNQTTCQMILLMSRIIREHMDDSLAKRKEQFDIKEERENKEMVDRIADMLHDAVPQWRDAICFAGQRDVHSEMQRKMSQIEQNRRNVLRFLGRRSKGLSTRTV